MSNYVVLITGDSIGSDNKELGSKLMSSYLYTLSEAEDDELPSQILLLNSGVYLAAEGQDTLEFLKELEDRGVSIMSCGICVEYFQIEQQIQAGEIGNMYTNMELMAEANKVITIG